MTPEPETPDIAGPGAGSPEPRVVIAHEWLVKYAGSERVVEELARAFPNARILTTILEPSRVPPLLRGASPSLLQYVPHAADHYQQLLPLMPLSWRLRGRVDDADVVISSSHACVTSLRVAPGIPHVCYCHTPMRYAWDFDLERERFPPALGAALEKVIPSVRRWDRRRSRRVTRYVANSHAVAGRIRDYYGRTAQVVHPPVRTDFFTPGEDTGEEPYFLYVGRFVAYKKADLVAEAFQGLPYRLVMVGDGPLLPAISAAAGPNVTLRAGIDDDELRALYRGATALVYPCVEDFGIVMAEAQACGTPVIGVPAGGALDIVRDNTGWLVEPTVADLRTAIHRAAAQDLDRAAVRANAMRFSSTRFRAEMEGIVREMSRR